MNDIVYIFNNERFFLWCGSYGKKNKYFLFDTEKGDIFRLNATSFKMLSLFNGEKTVMEILNILLSQYSVSKEKLERDFYELVKVWIKKEILIERRKNNGRDESD
ncbi:MAG: PqqD family protein [Candidatus Hydrogenedens sp.]|nr:PqqD family protein [Candidatus Hydrogenedens sp.]